MIYAMSDIHGCYEKYLKMLDEINFSSNDILYILGDVVDRGPDGMKVLLDIVERENVILLRGNHDHWAGILLSNLHMLDEVDCPQELIELYGIWLSNGGKASLVEYLQLSDEEQRKVIDIIKKTEYSAEITVGNKKYLLSHTVPGIKKIDEYEEWTLEDYIMGDPNYEEWYFEDMYVVTGHTPTGFIDPQSVGKIWKGNKHIAIDCGAVFGKTLGCICLDTLKEFYII